MEILKRDGTNPLPKINHRNGNPQPQIGVQVQRNGRGTIIFSLATL